MELIITLVIVSAFVGGIVYAFNRKRKAAHKANNVETTDDGDLR